MPDTIRRLRYATNAPMNAKRRALKDGEVPLLDELGFRLLGIVSALQFAFLVYPSNLCSAVKPEEILR